MNFRTKTKSTKPTSSNCTPNKTPVLRSIIELQKDGQDPVFIGVLPIFSFILFHFEYHGFTKFCCRFVAVFYSQLDFLPSCAVLSGPWSRSIPCRVTSHVFPDLRHSSLVSRGGLPCSPVQRCLTDTGDIPHLSAASAVVIISVNSNTIPHLRTITRLIMERINAITEITKANF